MIGEMCKRERERSSRKHESERHMIENVHGKKREREREIHSYLPQCRWPLKATCLTSNLRENPAQTLH